MTSIYTSFLYGSAPLWLSGLKPTTSNLGTPYVPLFVWKCPSGLSGLRRTNLGTHLYPSLYGSATSRAVWFETNQFGTSSVPLFVWKCHLPGCLVWDQQFGTSSIPLFVWKCPLPRCLLWGQLIWDLICTLLCMKVLPPGVSGLRPTNLGLSFLDHWHAVM